MLTPERWPTVRDILEQAMELAPEKRARFLDLACSSDPSLRDEVESLLVADGNAPSGFLESPPVRAAHLSPGTKIGDCEIVSHLGTGGMGVVYRARDLRLGRSVAIKLLRAHLSDDPSRLRRFEQEAQAAAALNHPNILTVYQSGVYQGAPYLVTELLEGETLREELKRGPLPQTQAVELAEQVAAGLNVAHQRGIVHRDLKPENLFISRDGRLKILDFGLAKLLAEGQQSTATIDSQTQAGTITGTVAYVSPEQVRGEKVDARTDLFSFGVVLYEMATGQRPFTGDTSGMIFEAILNRQPLAPSQINPHVTPDFERIILKALEKDRDVRYQGAAEIRADLKRLKRDSESGQTLAAKPVSAQQLSKQSSERRLKRLVAPVAVLGAVILAVWFGAPAAKSVLSTALKAPSRSVHAQIDPPPSFSFRLTGDTAGPPVISPNGDYVAFSATAKDGKFKLWVRAMNSIDARPLPDTDGALFPFWSPDSSSLGFFADGKLKSISVVMGSPVVVCDAPDGRGGAWGNGEIVFTPTPTSALFRVNATGGTPQPATRLEGTKYTTHRWPSFLPDKQHFLYFAASHEPALASENMVYYASLDGRENHPLFHAETNAVFADGVLLFASGDSLMTRAFDVGTLEVGKEPVLLARGVINDPVTWHADVSATDAGILVYGRTGPGPRQLIWLDQRTYSQTEIAVDGLSKLFLARLSPQGDRVVLQKDREGRDISVFDLREKATRSSLPKLHSNGFPIWSPDGKAIAYSSFRDGRYQIYRTSADGNGDEKELLSDEQRIIPDDWKGNTLIYFRGGLGNQFECWSFALDTKRKRKVFDNIDGCQLSPDGKWIAYAAHEYQPGTTSPGPLNVYVTKFAGGQGKYQVSENSGLGPRWSQDGTELYFLEQTTLSLVRVSVKFSANVPRFRVLSRSSANTLAEPVYAVSPDKERILIERIPEPTVVVVTSFVDTVKQRLRD